jgi:hypothetical protein
MADQPLTDLPVAATLTGAEILYGVQSGDSVKISTNQIKTFANEGVEVPRGTFLQTTTQNIANPANAEAIIYDLSIDNISITVVGGSKITVQNTGAFAISFSAIGHNAGSSNARWLNIFLKKNGNFVGDSSTIVSVSKDAPTTVVATFVVEATAPTDYWELFLAGQDTGCEILATPAQAAVPGVSPAMPACPSIIVAVWQIR